MVMKAKKVSRIEFVIDLNKNPNTMRFLWKEGNLYLSIRGVLLSSDDEWYEVNVKKIKDITLDENGLLTIDFGEGIIKIVSRNINSLRAFRHFLLPYVNQK